jgi:HSP20 family molecular chaperone IbpA
LIRNIRFSTSSRRSLLGQAAGAAALAATAQAQPAGENSVIVQSTGKPGQIRVTASSPGLKSSSVTVTTKG